MGSLETWDTLREEDQLHALGRALQNESEGDEFNFADTDSLFTILPKNEIVNAQSRFILWHEAPEDS